MKRHYVLSLALMLFLESNSGHAGILNLGSHTHTHSHVPQVCYIPCYTLYKAGDESTDLQVHLRGDSFNVLEIYFNENVERYTIPGGVNICTHGRVLMPRKNDQGTFAVQYGLNGFTAFGWTGSELFTLSLGRNEYRKEKDQDPYHIVDINIDPRYAIRLEWVTNRIARIIHGPNFNQEYLVRFNGDSKPWEVVYCGPVGTH